MALNCTSVMHHPSSVRLCQRSPILKSGKCSQRILKNFAIRAQSSSEAGQSRREMLLAGGAVLAAPFVLPAASQAVEIETQVIGATPVDKLSFLQKSAQISYIKDRAFEILKETLSSNDAKSGLRLLLNDAGTYDAATKTGGVDGSVVLSGEIDRPENKDLKDYVGRLTKAKEILDSEGAKFGRGPISWADFIVLGAKVATLQSWTEIKISKSDSPQGGKTIQEAFGAEWNIKIGRTDSGAANANLSIPSADASVDEIKAAFARLGTVGGAGFGTPRPIFYERPIFVIWTAAQPDPVAAEAKLAEADSKFAEWKKSYDRSRRSLTRTDYEVDFIDYFTRLSNIGAKYDPNSYLVAAKITVPKRL